MKQLSFILLTFSLLAPWYVNGQGRGGGSGVEIGPFVLRPGVQADAAYDDRASIDEAANTKESDYYGELESFFRLNNRPARYGLTINGAYGERFYADFSERNDNFYNARAQLSSGQNPLQWSVSSSVDKSLGSDASADSSTGEGPEGILSGETSRNWTGNAGVSYERGLSDRVAVLPSLRASYYYQEFETQADAEYETYSAGCQFAYGYSSRTFLTLSGRYELQINEDEDGTVASVFIGARGIATDEITWDASVGYSKTDYDESGADDGFVGDLRVIWQITDKVSTYVFGNQGYQPGYGGGGARQTSRAGYGVNWTATTRWSVSAQGLHDYEDEIDGTTDTRSDGVEHYFSASTGYEIGTRARVFTGINFANDEYRLDQTVVSAGLRMTL